MPRRVKERHIGFCPGRRFFVPVDGGVGSPVVLGFDELEAMRLADIENLSQEEAAAFMMVSRATFGRIVSSAHKKLASALIQNRPIEVIGGSIQRGNLPCESCPPPNRGRCRRRGRRDFEP